MPQLIILKRNYVRWNEIVTLDNENVTLILFFPGRVIFDMVVHWQHKDIINMWQFENWYKWRPA